MTTQGKQFNPTVEFDTVDEVLSYAQEHYDSFDTHEAVTEWADTVEVASWEGLSRRELAKVAVALDERISALADLQAKQAAQVDFVKDMRNIAKSIIAANKTHKPLADEATKIANRAEAHGDYWLATVEDFRYRLGDSIRLLKDARTALSQEIADLNDLLSPYADEVDNDGERKRLRMYRKSDGQADANRTRKSSGGRKAQLRGNRQYATAHAGNVAYVGSRKRGKGKGAVREIRVTADSNLGHRNTQFNTGEVVINYGIITADTDMPKDLAEAIAKTSSANEGVNWESQIAGLQAFDLLRQGCYLAHLDTAKVESNGDMRYAPVTKIEVVVSIDGDSDDSA